MAPDAAGDRVPDVASFLAPGLGLSVELAFEESILASVRMGPPAPARAAAHPIARDVAALVARHLETGREDLSGVSIDLHALPPFEREALTTLRKVRAGATITYGELCARVGRGTARGVGTAMAHNPLPIVVPCHRVLPSTGELGHYSGYGGVETKLALLRLEGARL